MKDSTKNWMNFAEKDLKAAEELVDKENLSNIVLFHCQQSIEKALKSLLEENDMQIPKIHSVFTLYKKLPDNIKNILSFDINELEMIDEVYIDSRYPADIGLLPNGQPTIEDGKTFFNISKVMIEKIQGVFGSI
ncbi:HEPN domain-containing protein [bacterium]